MTKELSFKKKLLFRFLFLYLICNSLLPDNTFILSALKKCEKKFPSAFALLFISILHFARFYFHFYFFFANCTQDTQFAQYFLLGLCKTKRALKRCLQQKRLMQIHATTNNTPFFFFVFLLNSFYKIYFC